jgi:YidC/Oxa1 family membrane protein insertase
MKLQEKFKGKTDPLSRQAMAQEQMDLYKRHGTGPLSACLPALVQVPFLTVLSGIGPPAAKGQGLAAMSAEQVAQFEASSIIGAPLSASLLNRGAGDPFSVSVLAILMILAMTAAQFITRRHI